MGQGQCAVSSILLLLLLCRGGAIRGAAPDGHFQRSVRWIAIADVQRVISIDGHGAVQVWLGRPRRNQLNVPARSVPKGMLQPAAIFVANVRESLFIEKQRAAKSDPGAALENRVDGLNIPARAFAPGKPQRAARTHSIL